MATIYVQFAADQETIVSAYAVAQLPVVALDTSDPRWKTYYDALPSWAQAGWPEPTTASTDTSTTGTTDTSTTGTTEATNTPAAS